MIGILSDTHDNLNAIRRAVSFFRDAGCRLIIHAGDFVAPFAAKELAAANCPVSSNARILKTTRSVASGAQVQGPIRSSQAKTRRLSPNSVRAINPP
jgi:predicted phosphodiesterase